MEKIVIRQMSRGILKKCDCCNKVQEVVYRCDIHNHENPDLIEGDLYLCRRCGDNLHKIVSRETSEAPRLLGEKVVKSFTF